MTFGGRSALGTWIVAMLVAGAPLVAHGSAVAQTDDDAARRAAAEIAAARDRANEAAAAFFAAQSELEQLGDRAVELEAEATALQARVDSLLVQVERVAISRFASSGSTLIPLLTDSREPNDRLQADLLTNVAQETSADAMDDYQVATRLLEEHEAEVAENREDVAAQQERFEELREEAEAQIVQLEEVEAQRLEDERVQA
ncbi:MAG: hypothetical protein M3487_04315, partial [Actinomycetota bacterium]|nr:hypothetical protein [Actinomycetota bacterium]